MVRTVKFTRVFGRVIGQQSGEEKNRWFLKELGIGRRIGRALNRLPNRLIYESFRANNRSEIGRISVEESVGD